MFDNILVPTDGSDNAEAAIDHATRWAEAFDATVHGLYVVNVSYAADFEGGANFGSILPALEEEGAAALEVVESRCSAAGVDVTTEQADGRPAREISTYAMENDVDLVVMGTHGRSGVSRLLLGSVTESVIRHCDNTVLTVPAGAPDIENYSDLLLATDGSEDATYALETAIDIGSAFESTIHGIYVIDSSFTKNQMIDQILEEEGEKALATVEENADEANLEFTGELREGKPHATIDEYATERDADLVVMGSHGKGTLERTVLGSVTERTIRTAERPVLITRRPLDSE